MTLAFLKDGLLLYFNLLVCNATIKLILKDHLDVDLVMLDHLFYVVSLFVFERLRGDLKI